jgi:hypothetical protein
MGGWFDLFLFRLLGLLLLVLFLGLLLFLLLLLLLGPPHLVLGHLWARHGDEVFLFEFDCEFEG